MVIAVTRLSMSPEDFAAWGWRIPFLLSAILVLLALYIRLRLQETPLFSALKSQGKSSTSPWRESFGDSRNAKLILLALFGATAGQAVIWYQGQFQALFFLGTNLGVQVHRRVPHRGHGDRPRDAVLPRVRAPVGFDRTEEGDPRRLPVGCSRMSRSTT